VLIGTAEEEAKADVEVGETSLLFKLMNVGAGGRTIPLGRRDCLPSTLLNPLLVLPPSDMGSEPGMLIEPSSSSSSNSEPLSSPSSVSCSADSSSLGLFVVRRES
jgi:hypothetical protein